MQALALVSSALIAGIPVDAVAPVPAIGFILQMAALGTAIGSVVALRAKRRNPDTDTWAITTAWASLGLVIGTVAVGITALAG